MFKRSKFFTAGVVLAGLMMGGQVHAMPQRFLPIGSPILSLTELSLQVRVDELRHLDKQEQEQYFRLQFRGEYEYEQALIQSRLYPDGCIDHQVVKVNNSISVSEKPKAKVTDITEEESTGTIQLKKERIVSDCLGQTFLIYITQEFDSNGRKIRSELIKTLADDYQFVFRSDKGLTRGAVVMKTTKTWDYDAGTFTKKVERALHGNTKNPNEVTAWYEQGTSTGIINAKTTLTRREDGFYERVRTDPFRNKRKDIIVNDLVFRMANLSVF